MRKCLKRTEHLNEWQLCKTACDAIQDKICGHDDHRPSVKLASRLYRNEISIKFYYQEV